jgi:hypothetical protein
MPPVNIYSERFVVWCEPMHARDDNWALFLILPTRLTVALDSPGLSWRVSRIISSELGMRMDLDNMQRLVFNMACALLTQVTGRFPDITPPAQEAALSLE